MYTLGLQPPDGRWYMDTGATSHMTADAGNLSSYVNSSISNGIIVGNGQSIPIKGFGHTSLTNSHQPLHLKNVIHVLQIVKNLVSVRKFTTDNSVTVEFDPFGFCKKNYKTGTKILRCNSHGDLYPFIPPNTSSTQFAGLAASSAIWHARLGHPGTPVFQHFSRANFISCDSNKSNSICSPCSMGKIVKQPFFPSYTRTLYPFDIIHCDLWTSPVLSSSGHRYYLLILDDFTNFVWTFLKDFGLND